MPANKDLKRLVRARMQKTGESYTAARANLLKTARPADLPDLATRAGMRDATVKASTGRTWKQWVRLLDTAGAITWSHRAIALWVRGHQIPGWWAQSVAVGYERIKGLRAVGQRRDGSFEATKSRTFAVPVGRLYRAWSEKRRREGWLPEPLTIRTSTRDRSMRITWPDQTSVSLWFTSKGTARSTVQVQHEKLPSRAAADEMKRFWGARLDALRRTLTG